MKHTPSLLPPLYPVNQQQTSILLQSESATDNRSGCYFIVKSGSQSSLMPFDFLVMWDMARKDGTGRSNDELPDWEIGGEETGKCLKHKG